MCGTVISDRHATFARLAAALIAASGLLLVSAAPSHAQGDRPGSTAAEFLRIGVSARAAGLAGAYMGVVDGAYATYYNPSGLTWQSDGVHVALNHASWFDGINHEFLAVSSNVENIGSFGVSVTTLYTDAMDETTPLDQGGTGKTFRASDLRVGLSYARQFTGNVSFGGSLNFVNETLFEGFSEQAYSLDISASYRAGYRNFQFGMMIANVGTEIEFVDESYPLPTRFEFGGKIDALNRGSQRVMIAASGLKPNNSPPLARLGLEYAFSELLFLRGGYHVNHSVKQFAFGGGLNLEVDGGYQFRADYSYSDFSLLGAAHRFGATITI
jgi:hypothetical protein